MGYKNKLRIWLAALVVVVVLLVGCTADTDVLLLDTPTPPPAAEQPEVSEPEVVQEPEPTPETESSPEIEQPTDAPVEPTPTLDTRIPEPELGFERGDPKLKATDPKAFVRAAEKPQLVELFAFW